MPDMEHHRAESVDIISPLKIGFNRKDTEDENSSEFEVYYQKKDDPCEDDSQKDQDKRL
eukprot:CAMPEP_0114581088 /NCGR_PEP_ID=MMETSP0125-20121206/5230_1 /TAXON_ID=485358 ORGANISM="Aristerostoma sp., Strain ATCC 50986" /NCGR_SAMPLE_ID=MMETSP0125 /ASSEMBLY_ACC=CAM_ASM_000245 /LENGTH=58 /DNA_ID=CAMNT_0001773013 /DNA_START=5179 /DNA_END=5355 /DNA_ORIENTATION=-